MTLPRRWTVEVAKARFSELLASSVEQGPQIVTIAEWRRLQRLSRPSLKELLLADEPRFDLAIPKRGALRRRSPEPLE
jgi:antitoxin Phd